MSVIRLSKSQDPFVRVNKSMLEDPDSSLRLKGFLTYCLAKPDDWQFHVSHLSKVLKEGRDAIYSTIEEGIELGYIERVKQQNSKGQFTQVDYIVYDTKQDLKKCLPLRENPEAAAPLPENPQLLKNDLNKKDINKNHHHQSNLSSSSNSGSEQSPKGLTDDFSKSNEGEPIKVKLKPIDVEDWLTAVMGQLELKGFEPDLINLAVKKMNESPNSISNKLRYLETVCRDLKNKRPQQKAQPKSEAEGKTIPIDQVKRHREDVLQWQTVSLEGTGCAIELWPTRVDFILPKESGIANYCVNLDMEHGKFIEACRPAIQTIKRAISSLKVERSCA